MWRPRSGSDVLCLSSLFLKTGSSADLELTDLGMLAGQKALDSSVFIPQPWGHSKVLLHQACYVGTGITFVSEALC